MANCCRSLFFHFSLGRHARVARFLAHWEHHTRVVVLVLFPLEERWGSAPLLRVPCWYIRLGERHL